LDLFFPGGGESPLSRKSYITKQKGKKFVFYLFLIEIRLKSILNPLGFAGDFKELKNLVSDGGNVMAAGCDFQVV